MAACDVAIVGGGIIGGSIAFELARQKLRVVLLDKQQPGREASWAAAGMLSPSADLPDSLPLVPLARASFDLYPEYIAAVEGATGLSTGYRRDGAVQVFFPPEGETECNSLVGGYRQLGLTAETISPEEARRREPALGPAARAAAWLPEEASVDPRALTAAVLAAATQMGAEIRADAAATSLAIEGRRCAGPVAAGERISARWTVIAAGCFSGGIDWLGRYAPTIPVRGQMVALRPAQARLGLVLRSERGYIVPRNDGRIIAGSTLENAGFEKSVTAAGLEQILGAAVELMPALKDAEIAETWAGLRPGTPDHLPVLGATDIEGLLIATGHYRNGILLAPVTARLLREWIVDGRTSLPIEKFSPLRFVEEKRVAGRSS